MDECARSSAVGVEALALSAALKAHPLRTRAGVEEVDLHRVQLRFAALRVPSPRRLAALVRSLERSGQLNAVVAVPTEAAHLVLVDGYLRIAALRRLGADTVWVQVWDCALDEALVRVLAANHRREWDVVEEALVLRELVSQGHSQHAVARRTGRDVSWVSRRLTLLDALPEALLEAVCQGLLSSWAASRILAPVARANSAHAHALLGALRHEPLSTRELNAWYQHYREANRATRERLVEHPALFVKALVARADEAASKRLRDGPEGQCLSDVHALEAIVKRLRKRLAKLCAHGAVPVELRAALAHLQATFAHLQSDLQRESTDDSSSVTRGGAHARCAPHAATPDQPPAQAVTQHGTAYLAPAAALQGDASAV
jgi:ParB-like chromosome segregation protein Spo0J